MDAHRVDILDRADDDGVVGTVPHDLELELLPPGHRLLDQDLVDRARRQSLTGHPNQLRRRRGQAAPSTAEHEGGADGDRIADPTGHRPRLFDRAREPGSRQGKAGPAHRGDEQPPVFGPADGVEAGTDEANAVAVQRPRLRELHRHVERGLPSQRGQQGIRTLPFDHPQDGSGRERQ